MKSRENQFAVLASAWFDGETHHRQASTFLIRNRTIETIVPGDVASEFAARGIEVKRGAFLMPGLVDAHVHLFLDGAATDGKLRGEHLKQPVEVLTEAARASARQSLGCGVTRVRDAGDRHGINHAIRAEARDPDSGMAQVRSGGLGVKRPKRYGAFMAMDVADADAIRASVMALARNNDEIKLILTGIIDFDAGAVTDEPQFDLEATRLLVDTARQCGRRVFAHCSGVKGLEIAIEAGVGSIEHGFFMNRDHLRRMADRGIAWTPTFCPVHFQWAHPQAAGWSAQTVGNLRRILDDHARHLLQAHELGVRLLVGTDAGSMGVEHGRAVFEEIDRFLEAGLPLESVLKAATSAPRRHFGEEAILGAGAPFEAILLDGSPFSEVPALRRPLAVWTVPTGPCSP